MKEFFIFTANNKLSLNNGKTEILFAGNKTDQNHFQKLNLHFKGQKLEIKKEVKYLGVQIDSKLTFESHIQKVNTKLNQAIGMCKTFKYALPRPFHKRATDATFYLKASYCQRVYMQTQPKYWKCLEKTQKRQLRIMYEKDRLTPSNNLWKSSEWLSFSYQCEKKIINKTFQGRSKLLDLASCQARKNNSYRINPIRHKSNWGGRISHNISARLFNNLPLKLRMEENDNNFYREYNWFISHKKYVYEL